MSKLKSEKLKSSYSMTIRMKTEDNEYISKVKLENAGNIKFEIFGKSYDRDLVLNLVFKIYREITPDEKELFTFYKCVFSKDGFRKENDNSKTNTASKKGALEGFQNLLNLKMKEETFNKRGNYEVLIFDRDDEKVITGFAFDIV